VATVLYTSTEIHSKIKQLLGTSSDGRRVAIVAYVGTGALAYIPRPKALELICCPEPGATSHSTVNTLIARGAEVRFADKLHMKVYWSEHGGCLITSANLSTSALGAGGLKECGVYLPAGAVDIDRLIRLAKPKRVTASAMRSLDREAKRLAKRGALRFPADTDQRNYSSWHRQPFRQTWKLGWWDKSVPAAKAAEAKARVEYDVREPHDYISCRAGQLVPGDWVLTFKLTERTVTEFGWLYVDPFPRVTFECTRRTIRDTRCRCTGRESTRNRLSNSRLSFVRRSAASSLPTAPNVLWR
jgi:hypothetical protein